MDLAKPFFWADSTSGRVRFIAAAFGYGPRVAAEVLAEQLQVEIGPWSYSDGASVNGAPPARLVLNFGSEDIITLSRDADHKVWIDCLMWLRKAIPESVKHYDLFLAEAFFVIRDELLSSEHRIEQIAPLYPTAALHSDGKDAADSSHILVSFGGVETPYTRDVHRYTIPTLVLRSIVQAVEESKDPRPIICCSPQHLAGHFARVARSSRVSFKSPDHREFIELLRGSSLYIVQPGLYGPFEAFHLGVTTVSSTPSTYTQICQARAYEENSLLGPVPLWRSLDEEIEQFRGDLDAEEPLCFERVASWLEKVGGEPDTLRAFSEWAGNALKKESVDAGLTLRRAAYARSCRSYGIGFIETLLGFLS